MHDAVRSLIPVPILETERLRLRGHRVDDLAPCAAMWADPVVVRHTSGKPLSREETWTRILRYPGMWSLLGYGFWVLVEKAGGEFVGEAGFADFKRDLQPSIDGAPEAGWVLSSRFHGRGYATEAMRAITTWGDEHFGNARTVCIIHPENAASIHVAGKCGYREYCRSMYKEHEVILFERKP